MTRWSQSKSMRTQASLVATTTTSSQSDTSSVITTTTQGPTQPTIGGDWPTHKNVLIAQTCHDDSLLVIGTQTGAEEKKIEESKDGATTLVPSGHTTLVPSPHTTLVPSCHITPIPSSHHSPIPSASASLLRLSGSPIKIVDFGDGKSSSSEPNESNKVGKET